MNNIWLNFYWNNRYFWGKLFVNLLSWIHGKHWFTAAFFYFYYDFFDDFLFHCDLFVGRDLSVALFEVSLVVEDFWVVEVAVVGDTLDFFGASSLEFALYRGLPVELSAGDRTTDSAAETETLAVRWPSLVSAVPPVVSVVLHLHRYSVLQGWHQCCSQWALNCLWIRWTSPLFWWPLVCQLLSIS